MRNRKRRQMLRRLVVALAVAAIAAPAAQARPDEGGAGVRPDDQAVRFAPAVETRKYVDTSAGKLVVSEVSRAERNDYAHFGYRRALPQDHGVAPQGAPREVAPASGGREIDWLSPGILAGLVLSGAALMALAALAVRRSPLLKH